MNRNTLIGIIIVFLIAVAGGVYYETYVRGEPLTTNEEAAVRVVVENFGKKMQQVSLQQPAEQLAAAMREHYGELVSPELLAEWITAPDDAPGRLTSSPWPDRITITTFQKTTDTRYDIAGKIIEVTSVEEMQGGSAAERPAWIAVEKVNSRWIITKFAMESYGQGDSWKTITDVQTGAKFQYPAILPLRFITAQEWPPKLAIVSGAFSCPEGEFTADNGLPASKARRTVNERVYCVESQTEGAAGTLYIDYAYTTARSRTLMTLLFTLRYPQCGSYNETERNMCQQEREAFDLDRLVDRIMEGVQLP